VIRKLAARDVISIELEVVARDPFATRASGKPDPHEPTPAQRTAIDALEAGKGGDVFLLHGVTGSGKTMVYIELLREVVERRGQTAIVLVPEIALTPQTVDRFRAVFGDRVAVLHSALSDGERYDAWLALQRGEKSIAVGARSAVFAPLERLGAIIVDEEHEGSYKNGETPRYHAREVAVVRARHEGAVVVLGSATPSLESWRNCQAGKFKLLSLPGRVGAGRLPSVEVVDLRSLDKRSHQSHLSHEPRAPHLPLLPPRGAARARLPALRRSHRAAAWTRHPTGGAPPLGALPVRAHRSHGCRHHQRKVGARRDPRSRGER
jgi:primosomal protein N' (replication factor Y)